MTTTIRQKKKTSHLLHLILTILTLGFWLPIWVLASVATMLSSGTPVAVVQTTPVSGHTTMTQSDRIQARHAELVRKGKIRA